MRKQLLKLLGGVPKEIYIAAIDAHKSTLNWFGKTRIMLATSSDYIKISAVVIMDEHKPISSAVCKRDMAKEMTNALMQSGLISYDSTDDEVAGCKLYRGTLIVAAQKQGLQGVGASGEGKDDE
jgi:hypothetical protein